MCQYYSFLTIFLLVFLNFVSHTSQYSLENGKTFDFIVVGGGTAGCVVASKLAENGKYTVLLIHEGGVPSGNLSIPMLSELAKLSQNFPNDLKFYRSVPQLNAGLSTNGTLRYTIGKSIGGGSSVNSMMWNRGNPKDYDNWAKLTKDESWSYENLLAYFRKSENYVGFNPTIQRGFGGPVTISKANYYAPSIKNILQAGQEIGYPIGDPNGPQTPSVNLVDFSQNRGRRVSSFFGYFQPLLENSAEGKRSNLFVLLNTEAKRVIFEGNKAVGVTFSVSNSSVLDFAKAKKEIILSAGALDSPAILMRSGIGPEDVLREAKIPVIKNLPVGRNLQDHVTLVLPIIYGNRSAVIVPSRDLTPEMWQLYQNTGAGPYSSMTGIAAQGFFLSNLQQQQSSPFGNWPDIHLIPHAQEANSSILQDVKDTEVVVYWIHLFVRPKSRGTVKLNTENIDAQPLIDFQFLSHTDDRKVMLDAVKISETICEKTSSMRKIGCRFPSTTLPACGHLKFRSEAFWECFIQQMASPGIHAGGTCRMGSGAEDPEAVVDSQLKVIGVEGVRVADASVFPEVTNANTQAPVYIIAEKVSDLILKRWEEEEDANPFNLNLNSFFGNCKEWTC